MADTSFVSKVTVIATSWLNQVNKWLFWGRRPNYAATTGSANAQVLTLETGSLYSAGSEADGDEFWFKAGFTNTGAATLNVLPSGGTNTAVAVQLEGAALTGGEIQAGVIYKVIRLGSTWQLSKSSQLKLAGMTAQRTLTLPDADLTLPAITAKGDTWNASVSGVMARKAAPADGYIRMADSAQADGWQDVPYRTRKNVIIGGDFSTNPWQRGTSFTGIATNKYSADRFKWEFSGAGVVDASKQADAPTVAQAGILVKSCHQIAVATADASIAAGDYYLFVQDIMGYNALPVLQRSATLSFWHKHTKTGTYCVAFRSGGDDMCYIAEYTQSVSDTWEKATINLPASPTSGTWDYTTGIGLTIVFAVAAGSTYQTAAGSWTSGNWLASSNQVNGMDSTSNRFRIALVQLEPGDVATEFETLSGHEVLDLCLPYCWVQGPSSSGVPFAIGQCISTTDARINIRWPKKMITSPVVETFTLSAAGDFDVTAANGSATAVTALTLSNSDEYGGLLSATVASGLVAGNATRLTSDSGGVAKITYEREF